MEFEIGMFAQQGDVVIKMVSEVKGKRLNHKTLALGEATGHHHTITEGDAELYEENGVLFLKVNSKEAKLTHQEHNPITLPIGNYEIGIVREYDHLNDEVRNVAD